MLTIILFVLLLAAPAQAGAQEQLPALEFPRPGLDDTVAYRGYLTRFFRDGDGNTVQVVINHMTGRVVHLWADAANESISFTARDTSGRAAPLHWASAGVRLSTRGGRRFVQYDLISESPALDIGLPLLCSMRKERDFQYLGNHLHTFIDEPYVEEELVQLVSNLGRLPAEEQGRELMLLHAASIDELRSRLQPAMTSSRVSGRWIVTLTQPTFDGKNLLSLELSDDTSRSAVAIRGTTIALRSLTSRPVSCTVTVGTNSPSLTPLTRNQIFTKEFLRYYAAARARRDSLVRHPESDSDRRHSGTAPFALLDRQVRSVELLSFQEKLMAGLPNFATYFGRDMMMSAMMMEPILLPSMQEHVIECVLRKLSPEGKASHEESLGGQAIRENAAVYNGLIQQYLRHAERNEIAAADSSLSRARAVLAGLQHVREDYHMVDETVQLPVLVGRYLGAQESGQAQKKAFLLGTVNGSPRIALLMRNLLYVLEQAAPFASAADATSLVNFPRIDQQHWMSASWRDSGAGYANGRFAMDVNVIWVPKALEAIRSILATLPKLGISGRIADSLAPWIVGTRLHRYMSNASELDRAIRTWQGAAKFFEVLLAPAESHARLKAWLSWLPEQERAFWQNTLAGSKPLNDSLRFLALSLDTAGRPIPVMNTDVATSFFLDDYAGAIARGSMTVRDVLDRVRTFTLPYPVGLYVKGLGPLVANDAYAAPEVWESFKRDQYHSPRVVWGREVNLFLLGVDKQIQLAREELRRTGRPQWRQYIREMRNALARVRDAVEASGLEQSELWSYSITNGKLEPARYASSCDIQLWNLTDLAVNYVLEHHPN